MSEMLYAEAREEMVTVIAAYANVSSEATGKAALDERVMQAMATVPRHEFVPMELRPLAYVDSPLPIGFDKTISQPFICALMTDLLSPAPEEAVLEIGTGLGYQAAVLCELAGRVYSVEIVEELAAEARRRLTRAGYSNLQLRVGDGSVGWPQHAPFDKVMVTAAPELIPAALINQLKPGGRMVIPAGIETSQQLMVLEKDAAGKLSTREILPVRFSALTTSH
ncbi:MAG: protein-L-isoaspartate(D-aspartate) O-methyltransferase [Dongiaceae bacterium]